MHESTLARQLVEAVLARAGGARVRRVRGRVAETEALSREALELHFGAHARGTLAEGARLELELVHVRARCLDCGTLYLPAHHLLLCPGCGGLRGEELGERGLRLDALEVDAAQEVDVSPDAAAAEAGGEPAAGAGPPGAGA